MHVRAAAGSAGHPGHSAEMRPPGRTSARPGQPARVPEARTTPGHRVLMSGRVLPGQAKPTGSGAPRDRSWDRREREAGNTGSPGALGPRRPGGPERPHRCPLPHRPRALRAQQHAAEARRGAARRLPGVAAGRRAGTGYDKRGRRGIKSSGEARARDLPRFTAPSKGTAGARPRPRTSAP